MVGADSGAVIVLTLGFLLLFGGVRADSMLRGVRADSDAGYWCSGWL